MFCWFYPLLKWGCPLCVQPSWSGSSTLLQLLGESLGEGPLVCKLWFSPVSARSISDRGGQGCPTMPCRLQREPEWSSALSRFRENSKQWRSPVPQVLGCCPQFPKSPLVRFASFSIRSFLFVAQRLFNSFTKVSQDDLLNIGVPSIFSCEEASSESTYTAV